jgi:hypothetical protein
MSEPKVEEKPREQREIDAFIFGVEIVIACVLVGMFIALIPSMLPR